MKLAIMQPYLFPYAGYFQLMNTIDKFVFYDDVAFIKQGWINRNNILLNGEKWLFSVPVSDISSFTRINELRVSERPVNWEKKLLQTIRQAYHKAPFFDAVFQLIADVLMGCCGKPICSIAKSSIYSVMQYLGMDVQVVDSSAIYGNNYLRSEERVLDICHKENASVYVNLPGGRPLYNREQFKQAGVDLFFAEPVLATYTQFKEPFMPGLSVIDVLMFNNIDESLQLLSGCRISP